MKKIILPIIFLLINSNSFAQFTQNNIAPDNMEERYQTGKQNARQELNMVQYIFEKQEIEDLQSSAQYIDLIFYSASHKHSDTIIKQLEKLKQSYGFNIKEYPQDKTMANNLKNINASEFVHKINISQAPAIIAVSKISKHPMLVSDLNTWEGIEKDWDDLKTAITRATSELQKYDKNHKPL